MLYYGQWRHRQKLPGLICLARSREIAAGRIRMMDEAMAAFADESFGHF
jgi:hypothetical protein